MAVRFAAYRVRRADIEAELERREKAQLPLEEKRRRSDEVVVNDSTPEVLKGRVAEALQKLRGRVGRTS